MTQIPASVSVIIPVYDRPAVFLRCLDAIAAQTYSSLEVIVVNDGSPQTKQIRAIAQGHPVTAAYIEQENRGAPAARNEGFRHAKGEYVLFCDADTLMEPTMIAQLVGALHAHSEASYSYSGFYFGWKKFPSQAFDPVALRQNNYIATMALLRAEVFPGFDESLKRFQDWDVWLTLLENGKTGVFVPALLYRAAGGTMSSWLPSFFYKWFPESTRVRAYRTAKEIVQRKHGIL